MTPYGMMCVTSTGRGFANVRTISSAQSDLAGFRATSLYSTIAFADVDADGRADVYHRASAGVSCDVPVTSGQWNALRTAINGAVPDVRGVTVAAIENGSVVFARGTGYANAALPATPDIPFQIASISKLFIATALMVAVDQGAVGLDQTTGLASPTTFSQTIRQFANHTSGLASQVCYAIGNFEPSSDLAAATMCAASPSSWASNTPTAQPVYSNIGAAWIARVVELGTATPFDRFTNDVIFRPLVMTSTAWFRSQLSDRVAIGFDPSGNPTNDLGVTPYPMGNLRASALDLARFMMMWTGGGVAPGGQRVLSASSVAAAFPAPASGMFGVFWSSSFTTSGRAVFSHGGVMPGACTRLSIDPVTRSGVVILTNGSCASANVHINQIEDLAFRALDL